MSHMFLKCLLPFETVALSCPPGQSSYVRTWFLPSGCVGVYVHVCKPLQVCTVYICIHEYIEEQCLKDTQEINNHEWNWEPQQEKQIYFVLIKCF